MGPSHKFASTSLLRVENVSHSSAFTHETKLVRTKSSDRVEKTGERTLYMYIIFDAYRMTGQFHFSAVDDSNVENNSWGTPITERTGSSTIRHRLVLVWHAITCRLPALVTLRFSAWHKIYCATVSGSRCATTLIEGWRICLFGFNPFFASHHPSNRYPIQLCDDLFVEKKIAMRPKSKSKTVQICAGIP